MTRPVQVRSTYTVAFAGKSPRRATQAATGRVPRVVRTLARAHRVDEMIRAGELRDLTDAARASDRKIQFFRRGRRRRRQQKRSDDV